MKEIKRLSLEELFKLRELITAELSELQNKSQSELTELRMVVDEIELRQGVNSDQPLIKD